MAVDLQKQIDASKTNIKSLRLTLQIEEAILARLISFEPRKSRVSARPIKESALPGHIWHVLNGSDGPLSVGEIALRVKERGFSSNAKAGVRSLVSSAVRGRRDIFVRIRHGVFGLKTKHGNEPELCT